MISAPGKSSRKLLLSILLFCFLLFGLFLFHLFIDFRGLTHPLGMEKAEIARELASGNGFTTKSIRPLALHDYLKHNPESAGLEIPDTYHAPLAPAMLSLVFRPLSGMWGWQEGTSIYFLDRVVAGIYMLLLVASIGVTFVFLSRLFDTKIAAVACCLMVLSAALWEYAQSGLPQMLMLFLFCVASYLLHRAVVVQAEGRSAVRWLALSGLFFGLLALSSWLTTFVFLGALIYAGIQFRRQPLAPVLFLVVFVVLTVPWLVRNYLAVGDAMGVARYLVFAGLNLGDEAFVMRNYDPGNLDFSLMGLPTKMILNTLAQTNNLYTFLGAIIVAPLFFISLIHPFKRPDISSFRWGVLLMWVMGTIGMAIYGISATEKLHPNNIHILFIPLATGYGLAFLSVLWARLRIPQGYPLASTGHFVAALLLSGLPLVLNMPRGLKVGLFRGQEQAAINWPPYIPLYYDHFIAENTDPDEVIFADVPWAVAWYGDRPSYWLPFDGKQFAAMGDRLEEKGKGAAGVLLTPLTTHLKLGSEIMGDNYSEWSPLIMHAPASQLGVDTLAARGFAFPRAHPFTPGGDMVFYSDTRRW